MKKIASISLGMIVIGFILFAAYFSISDRVSGKTPTRIPTNTAVPYNPPVRNKVKIIDIDCEHDSIGNLIITGKVENIGNMDLRFVELRGRAVDPDGNTVNTDTSFIDSDVLAAGATSTYRIYVSDPSNAATRCEARFEDAVAN
jgi:hypothetical protein